MRKGREEADTRVCSLVLAVTHTKDRFTLMLGDTETNSNARGYSVAQIEKKKRSLH